jgi:hypothetical protein
MNNLWEAWICDPRGMRLKSLSKGLNFALTKVSNGVGAWQMTLPGNFNKDYLKEDRLVEFWMAPYKTMSMRCVMVGEIRKIRTSGYKSKMSYTISGPDENFMLADRDVAYYAGQSQTSKSGYADDLIKAVGRENFGSTASDYASDTTRRLDGYNVTVAADVSAAQAVSMGFSWKNCLSVMQNLALASKQKGTDLYFWMAPIFQADGTIGFELRTNINQPGSDLRYGNTNGVIFAPEYGNLDEPDLVEDYSNEATYVYACGPGDEGSRLIVTGSAAVISRSPWARREVVLDLKNQNAGTMPDIVLAELSNRRALVSFAGTLMDTDKTKYGIHWQHGDRVTVSYNNRQFDVVARTTKFEVQSGKTKISSKVEVVA